MIFTREKVESYLLVNDMEPKSDPKNTFLVTNITFLVTKTTFLVTEITFLVAEITFLVTEITFLVAEITFLVTDITFRVKEITVLVTEMEPKSSPRHISVSRPEQRTPW